MLDSIQTSSSVVDSGYSFMSVTTGDYDNDGKYEIAVSYPTITGSFSFCTFDYENGNLVQRDTFDQPANLKDFNLVDLTSGDFDGDGSDEIASVIGRCSTNDYSDTNFPGMMMNIWKMDQNLQIQKMSQFDFDGDDGESNKGAAITSGFFRFDPGNNCSTARRQLAMIFIGEKKEDSWEPWITTFDVDENFKITLVSYILGRGKSGAYPSGYTATFLKPEITAGRFLTLGNSGITDQIAASWANKDGDHSNMNFNVYEVSNDLKLSVPGSSQWGYGFDPNHGIDYCIWDRTSVPLVAACTQEGKSYYLGVPVHISVPNYLSAVRVIQEPPKHLDYLPDDSCTPGNPCEWGIVNVSKYDDFNASFEESTTKSITTKSTSQTNMDIGSSEETTAGETVEAGIPDIAGAKITSSQSKKVSYDYQSVTQNLNGNYSSVTFGESFDTSADDALQLKTMWIDIWRYPIYGLKTQEDKNAFYEVILPGKESYTTIAGINASDYYQPIHENGNLLSYPQISDSKFPYDLGSFDVEGQSYKDVMTLPHNLSFGGIEETYYVGWANKAWTETTTTQSKTINESHDFKIGFEAEAKWKIFGGSASLDLDFSSHNNSSWSNSSYSESETETDGRVTVNVPDADSEQGYLFRPILYTTTDGTLKLAHTVDTGTTASFWQRRYHGQPDLSLNLPRKFWWRAPSTKPAYGEWYMNPDRQLRSRMRGIFLYINDPEANKGKERYLVGSPTAGDTIYVQTYVYNYSLDTETGPFKVRFSYVPYDPNLKDGVPDLTPIGDVEVNNLAALERKEVQVKWDIAKDAGGDEPGAAKPYVIYVTLDPDNEVQNEIHELYVEDQSPSPSGPCPVDDGEYSKECGIFCGSNNQGYWPWDNSFKIFYSEEGEDLYLEAPADVSIVQKSLEIGFMPQSQGYGDYFFTHLPYVLKLKVVAKQAVKAYRDVFFYDNDKVFAMKRSFGLNPGENDFYGRWTPEEPGEHTLKVVIMEHEDDPAPGDNTVSLDVEVLDIKIPSHR